MEAGRSPAEIPPSDSAGPYSDVCGPIREIEPTRSSHGSLLRKGPHAGAIGFPPSRSLQSHPVI